MSGMGSLEKALDGLGVSLTKLKASASATANTASATTTVAGTVLKAATSADVASAIPAAAPAGGTGATAGAYDTAINRDAMIATVNGLRTAVSEIKTQHNDLVTKLRAAGVIV